MSSHLLTLFQQVENGTFDDKMKDIEEKNEQYDNKIKEMTTSFDNKIKQMEQRFDNFDEKLKELDDKYNKLLESKKKPFFWLKH